MQIIWNTDVLEEVKKTQIVLELETFDVEGTPLTAWCVVPLDKIKLENLATIEAFKQLHNGFVKALKEKNYLICKETAPFLKGQFGGELDTFYEEILKRIESEKESSVI
jgi:hypothetical protein